LSVVRDSKPACPSIIVAKSSDGGKNNELLKPTFCDWRRKRILIKRERHEHFNMLEMYLMDYEILLKIFGSFPELLRIKAYLWNALFEDIIKVLDF